MLYDSKGNLIQFQTGTVGHTTVLEQLRFQAHRGLSTDFPENTLAALSGAKVAGYDSVEIDPRITLDNVVVLCHDATIDRTSNGSGTISAMTYAAISQYDFGSWFSAEFTGEKIPTAEEALLLCKKIDLFPRFDSYFMLFSKEQQMELYALIERIGMARFVGFNCKSDLNIASEILGVLPEAELHFDYSTTIVNGVSTLPVAKQNVVIWISATSLTDALVKVEEIHAAGFRVGFWTIDNQDTATQLIDKYYADILESNGGVDPLYYTPEQA